jgi:hypothetical protein
LATTPDLPPADRAAALQLAQQVAAVGHVSPIVLDTLAAALAANGQFPDAVAAAEQAIAVAQRLRAAGLLTALQQRLALYRAGKPYLAALPGAGP